MSATPSRRPASAFAVSNVRAGRLDSPLAVLPFFVSYVLPIGFLASVRLAASGSTSALSNSWLCAWFVFAILPILEIVVPDDLANPTDEESERASHDRRYKIPLYLWCIPQTLVVAAGARAFCADAAAGVLTLGNAHHKLGLVLSTGVCTGGVGITIAHELLHKASALEKRLAVFLLTSVCYAHFAPEHRFGHHARVATPADPASARRYQSFYAFWPRSIAGTYRGAWRLWRGHGVEEDSIDFGKPRSNAPKKHGGFDGNVVQKTFGAAFMRDAHLIPCLWMAGLFYFCDFQVAAVGFFLLQALVAVTLLELVNYVEHYGLRRALVAEGSAGADLKTNRARRAEPRMSPRGVYEKVTPLHSWNAPQLVTNYFVFRLQRHSDHHARAMTPYQALRTYAEAPALPTGYTGAMLLALAPRRFEKCLAPVLDCLEAERREELEDDASGTNGVREEDARGRRERFARARAEANARARRRARSGVFFAASAVSCAAWIPRAL